MDQRTNKGFEIRTGKEKKEKEWKWSPSKDGERQVRIPSSMRVYPNKYKPGKGKTFKKLACFGIGNTGSKCKPCLWRYTCSKLIELKKEELSIPSFQDSTGDGV
jgi:hypothetical protein